MIAIEELGDGRWRWSFREPGRKLELVSNEDYESFEAARAAARTAYPGVPIEERGRGRPHTRQRRAATAGKDTTGKAARKVAEWLTPVVVLIAWSKSKRRRP